jgi:hypothetical protein
MGIPDPFSVSRRRMYREGGYLGRKRNYLCRKCGQKFQHDGFQLAENDRVCSSCRNVIANA